MFEALFRIVAQLESNGEGQRVFHVTEHGAPANESAFSSLRRRCISRRCTARFKPVIP
jgi:hypothetical protein